MSTYRHDTDQHLTADPIWPAAVAFDTALDQRAGDPASANASSAPSIQDLLDTAGRLRSAVDGKPRPDFASVLRRTLLQKAADRAQPRGDPAPAAPAIGIVPLPYHPARYQHRPVIRIAAFLIVALLVISGTMGGDTLFSNLAGNSDIFPIAIPARDQASPLAPRIESTCTVPPVDLQARMATVNAMRDGTFAPIQTPMTDPLSGGQPADRAVADGVYATVREFVACGNEGDVARGLALFTPDLVLRLFAGEGDVFLWEVPLTSQQATPRPEFDRITIRSLTAVEVLPDGRASVTVTMAVGDQTETSPPITFVLADTGGQWLISDVVIPEEGTPTVSASASIEIQTELDLRTSAAFAARVADRAAPGSRLNLIGPGEVIDGILWVPVNGLSGGLGPDQTYYLPAAYLMAMGARIPGILVPATGETGTPPPSECTAEPIRLADIATYMGPARSNGPRSAMALLATVGPETELVRPPVVAAIRELYACYNAGSYTQGVALYTQNFYQQAGADAYRPDGTETELAAARPLAQADRSEILAIGTVHQLDDRRVGVVVIGASHEDAVRVGSTFFILARSGDRWLIDDAIPIDSSSRPGGSIMLPSQPEAGPFAAATPDARSSQSIAQPIFPIGATVAVRGNTVPLHSLPRTNAEVTARLGPCACTMEVFGPMVDSGDGLWLPVTDLDTGVSGYISLDFVLPPEHMSQAGFRIGQAIVTTTTLRLRGVPEPSHPAEPALPSGTALQIAAIKINFDILWVGVEDPSGGGIKWAPWDLLVVATATYAGPPPATPSLTPSALAPAFALGQLVTVTSDGVGLREGPDTGFLYVDILREGVQLEVIGAPERVEDTIWYPARNTTSGEEGYVSGTVLQSSTPPDATPGPTLPATPS